MRRDWAVVLVLAGITLATYWQVVGHDFVNYDDPDYVTTNAYVQRGLTWDGIKWAFIRIHGGATYWHPLTWLSHMLDCQFFGLKPGPHHLVNLLFHTLNGVLLFIVLKRMTGEFWRSVIVAALWSVHPLQVDTVAWVTERKNLLSGLFWILSTGAYVRYAVKPNVGRYLLVLLGMTLGLMCKPVLVTLPCALLLLDLWPLGRWRLKFLESPASEKQDAPRFHPATPVQLVIEKIPLFAMAAISSVVTFMAHDDLGTTGRSHGLPLLPRIENALVSYARYLKKIFWPTDLAVLYPHPGKWPLTEIIASIVALGLITWLVLWRLRRQPYLAVGWFWFLGVLVPTIGILQVGSQAMADRFAYVPLIGFFILIVWGASDISAIWKRWTILRQSLAVAALAFCIIMTTIQLPHWRNSVTLYERALAVTEDNFIVHGNLSVTLFEEGRIEEAKKHAKEAILISPKYFPAHLQLAFISEREKNPKEAIVHYEQTLRLKPEWPAALKGFGRLLLQEGKLDEALTPLTRLIELTPDDPEAHLQLALLRAARRETAEAIAHYREALRLNPDSPEALNNLAWMLATHPEAEFRNAGEAVIRAERAVELSQRRKALFLTTLAAAYAEAGRFPDAVTVAQEAQQVALAASETGLAKRNEEFQGLFRAQKPYHESTPGTMPVAR